MLSNLSTPPLYLPAPNARSSECAVYSSVLVLVDVVEVNYIMGAGMGSFVLDEVVVYHAWLVSCFTVDAHVI